LARLNLRPLKPETPPRSSDLLVRFPVSFRLVFLFLAGRWSDLHCICTYLSFTLHYVVLFRFCAPFCSAACVWDCGWFVCVLCGRLPPRTPLGEGAALVYGARDGRVGHSSLTGPSGRGGRKGEGRRHRGLWNHAVDHAIWPFGLCAVHTPLAVPSISLHSLMHEDVLPACSERA
jgi:hypothetical protein